MTKQTTVTQGIDALAKHSFKDGKNTIQAIQVANEAEAIQTSMDGIEMDKQSFGKHFILLARTCKSPEDFLETLGTIEAQKSWKSKQNPDGNNDAPDVWRQTKSNMKVAWEKFGISPKDVKTTAELNQKLQEARKAANTGKKKDSNAETVTNAITSAASEDQNFANLLAKFAKLYHEKDEVERELLFDALAEVYNEHASTDESIAELMNDLDGVEVTQGDQAASH